MSRGQPLTAIASVALIALVLTQGPRVVAQRTSVDVLLRNGRIVDGTGAPWYRADVAIVGDRITAIGSLAASSTASLTIDATNLVVAPGFIDLLGQSEFNVLVDGRAASKIMQGVTTEVTGEGSRAHRHGVRRRAGLADARRLLAPARGALPPGDQHGDVRRRRRSAQLRDREG
jgi:hypothetical protein